MILLSMMTLIWTGIVNLLDCSNREFEELLNVSNYVPAVVIDRTFYWFNYLDMCLYGYDSKAESWIKSQCPLAYYQRFDYQRPLLLGLPKSTNKMLVILHTSCSELTITSLHVVENLRVLVETTRAYCFDNPDVVIAGVKAISKDSSLVNMEGGANEEA